MSAYDFRGQVKAVFSPSLLRPTLALIAMAALAGDPAKATEDVAKFQNAPFCSSGGPFARCTGTIGNAVTYADQPKSDQPKSIPTFKVYTQDEVDGLVEKNQQRLQAEIDSLNNRLQVYADMLDARTKRMDQLEKRMEQLEHAGR